MPSTIHEACRAGDLNEVQSLVATNSSLVDLDDEHQWRPVFHAAIRKHPDVVNFLLESGADLSAHDGYVLHYASEVPENKAIVQLLITYGALDAHVRPVDDLSRQFLAAVFLANESRVASMLGLHPELVTLADGRGDYPIHHASRNGDTNIVKLLLDLGADVNRTNSRGHTVLYCAGGHGHADCVQLLLDRGADKDARFTSDGQCLLDWLREYPGDKRLQHVANLLANHKN